MLSPTALNGLRFADLKCKSYFETFLTDLLLSSVMVHVHVSRFSLDKPENGESWWLIAKELEKEDDGRRKLEFPYETSHARIKLDSVVGIGFELSTDHQAVADWALGYITIVSKRAHSTTYVTLSACGRITPKTSMSLVL